MKHVREHVEQTIARTARLLEHAKRLTEDAKSIVHDARNKRHHAALLRTISQVMRRARAAGTGA